MGRIKWDSIYVVSRLVFFFASIIDHHCQNSSWPQQSSAVLSIASAMHQHTRSILVNPPHHRKQQGAGTILLLGAPSNSAFSMMIIVPDSPSSLKLKQDAQEWRCWYSYWYVFIMIMLLLIINLLHAARNSSCSSCSSSLYVLVSACLHDDADPQYHQSHSFIVGILLCYPPY